MMDRIVSNVQEARTRAVARIFHLSRLMLGEVRVTNAKNRVGEAT